MLRKRIDDNHLLYIARENEITDLKARITGLVAQGSEECKTCPFKADEIEIANMTIHSLEAEITQHASHLGALVITNQQY